MVGSAEKYHSLLYALGGIPRGEETPTILQAFESSGQLGETLYLFPGDPLPEAYTPQERRPLPLAITSGALALASGALYWQASRNSASFFDLDTPPEDLETYRVRTNALAAGSLGAGTVALALGVYTAVTW